MPPPGGSIRGKTGKSFTRLASNALAMPMGRMGRTVMTRLTVEFRGSHPHDKPGALAASTLIWVAWLAAFGVLEMLALVWKGCPWEPLSNWTRRLEDFSPVLPWLLLAGLGLLLAHLVWRVGWPPA